MLNLASLPEELQSVCDKLRNNFPSILLIVICFLEVIELVQHKADALDWVNSTTNGPSS